MIGAYSIGTFPIGSIVQETGLAIVSLELAEATASGNNIELFVALSLGKGESTASGKDAIGKQLLDMGFAESTATPNSFDLKILPLLGLATAVASGESPIPVIRLKIGRADATASGLNLVPKVDLELGRSEAQGFGINFQGVGIGTTLAQATANAQDIVTLTKLLTDVAESSTVAYDITQSITQPIGVAEATAQALDFADIVYVVDDVPQIQVDRTSTQAVVKVTNPSDVKNVRIFRADDHRGTFSELVANHDESSDYTDSGLDATKNFKYKCAFIVVGTKGGVEYIAVGERSAPVYTIGNQVL